MLHLELVHERSLLGKKIFVVLHPDTSSPRVKRHFQFLQCPLKYTAAILDCIDPYKSGRGTTMKSISPHHIHPPNIHHLPHHRSRSNESESKLLLNISNQRNNITIHTLYPHPSHPIIPNPNPFP
jgi:hypothetical protein